MPLHVTPIIAGLDSKRLHCVWIQSIVRLLNGENSKFSTWWKPTVFSVEQDPKKDKSSDVCLIPVKEVSLSHNNRNVIASFYFLLCLQSAHADEFYDFAEFISFPLSFLH